MERYIQTLYNIEMQYQQLETSHRTISLDSIDIIIQPPSLSPKQEPRLTRMAIPMPPQQSMATTTRTTLRPRVRPAYGRHYDDRCLPPISYQQSSARRPVSDRRSFGALPRCRRTVSEAREIFFLGGTTGGIRIARAYHIPRKTPYIRASVAREERRFQSTTTSTPTSAPHLDHTTPNQPPPKSRTTRILTTTALSLLLFLTAFAMSAAPAAETVNGYMHPPTDAETLELYHPESPSEDEINEHILTHPLSVALRADPDISESRPHMRIPPAMRPHNLTGGVLAGEGKIVVPPLNFCSKTAELPTMTQILYLGDAICGHPGIVHGGLLATLLDEGLARACFPALPNKVGVTASLKIDYRVPCPAGRYVVLKAETTKVEGRKAWVKGWIELLGEEDGEGVKLVEAEALFIEPRKRQGFGKECCCERIELGEEKKVTGCNGTV